MEIYLGVKPTIFAEMVGLGPVCNEKFSLALGFKPRSDHLPALVVQLTTGEVFTCGFDSNNLHDESAVTFERNFLVPEDFKKVGMAEKLQLLMQQGVPLRLFLGDSWDNERFLIWEKKDKNILKQIPIETALLAEQGYEIARRLELIYEFEYFKILCEKTELNSQNNVEYITWLQYRAEVETMIAEELPWLINSETHRSSAKSSKKPDLNFYEGTNDT